jgi:hypothetical protein
MSGPRFQKSRDPASLKEAVARLVNLTGGIEAAAKISRVSKSQIARYTDPAHDDCHMPVDIVRALEINGGDPVVTRYLASEAHALVVPLHPEKDHEPYASRLARIGREQGKFFGDACELIAKGRTPKNAAHVLKEAMYLAAALAAFIGDLRAITRESETP